MINSNFQAKAFMLFQSCSLKLMYIPAHISCRLPSYTKPLFPSTPAPLLSALLSLSLSHTLQNPDVAGATGEQQCPFIISTVLRADSRRSPHQNAQTGAREHAFTDMGTHELDMSLHVQRNMHSNTYLLYLPWKHTSIYYSFK